MSLVSVWDELWALIAQDTNSVESAPVSGLTKVRRVFKGEPVKVGADPGFAVTITSSGYADFCWIYWLRIYATIGERPIETQLDVATTVDQLETLLDANNRFERGDWEIGLTEDLGQWVATIRLRGPRE